MAVAAAVVAVACLACGWGGLGEVAVAGAIAVIHRTDEPARAALLLLTTFALKASRAVAGLMGIAVAVSAAIVAVAAPIAAAGDVAGVLRRTLTITIAEFFLPALAATGRAILLAPGWLEALLLWRLRSG